MAVLDMVLSSNKGTQQYNILIDNIDNNFYDCVVSFILGSIKSHSSVFTIQPSLVCDGLFLCVVVKVVLKMIGNE